jgi:hypothetical protein
MSPFKSLDDFQTAVQCFHLNNSISPLPDYPLQAAMMSKDQANAAAEALLAEANRNRVTKIPAVPRYLRCKELNVLDPRQRLELVELAKRNVRRNSFHFDWLVFYVLYVILLLILWQMRNEDFYRNALLALSGVSPWLFIVLSLFMVRKETIRLAKQIHR